MGDEVRLKPEGASPEALGDVPAERPVEVRPEKLSFGMREQWWYARLLLWCGSSSLALLALGFVVFLAELLPRFIGVDVLPNAWALSAQELRVRHGHPSGWAWLQMLEHSDILNLLGISLLASCSLVPLVAVAVLYWQGRERLYALLAGMQVVVLLAAASGLLVAGH